jgi:hypothetical protein
MKFLPLFVGLLSLSGGAVADPTWPASIDELEEIMFQLESFRARKFADTVSPCSNEASGPGRQNAAEWLRAAFHDMATATRYFRRGGLDGSLQYELTSRENKGPGLTTTLEFMAPYVSPRSSLADLLAMGVYTSVRSCGGPAVPIRAGRGDATKKGDLGVPQPENSVLSFQQQFDRMGFTNTEMIQVTACGHTLGGVHEAQFPEMVPVGSTSNGEAPLDGTVAVFDNKIVTEYLDGTTKNPLVVGPSIAADRNSDFKVFNSDRNVTMRAMADNTVFQNVCKAVLQKMIDTVPPGTVLTDPIAPYKVKPVALQLTLADGGASLEFTGFIRLLTTTIPSTSVDSVTITYKNREGGSACGSAGCKITSTIQGVSQGFDDTFAFYPIEAKIPAKTGISSFIVTVNYNDRAPQTFDNNGVAYPLTDAITLQLPQSCVLGSSGAMTVTAAVRNDRVAQGATAVVYYKTTRTSSPVPLLNNVTITLNKGDCVGDYTFFKADYTIPGTLAYQSYVDVISGDKSDSFNSVVEFGGSCTPFANPLSCGGGAVSSSSSSATSTSSISTAASVSSTSAVSSSTVSSSVSSSVSSAAATSTASSATSSTSASSAASSSSAAASTSNAPTTTLTTSTTINQVTTTTSTAPTQSLHHRQDMGEYVMVSCWSEGQGVRALRGDSFTSDEMTLEKCMDYCQDYIYWGTEFGKECKAKLLKKGFQRRANVK